MADLGVYCKCIEKKLPTLRGSQSLKALKIGSDIERKHEPFPWADTALSTTELKAKLSIAGLPQFEIDLIVSRVVEQKTMQEVVKEQGWSSEGSARHHLRSALKKLRKIGFTV